MKNKRLKAFFISLPVVLMILACCIPVGNTAQNTKKYKYEDGSYSETITLKQIYWYDTTTAENKSYYEAYYEIDDSGSKTTYAKVNLHYEKMVDGEEYYSTTEPLNTEYIILSDETLKYGDKIFYCQ